MPWYGWVIIALVFILIGGGLYVVQKISRPNRRSFLESSAIEEGCLPGIMKFYTDNLTEQYTVKTRDGLNLKIYYFKNNNDSNKYCVMSHGHTYNHHGCLKYARMMMKHGYNVVLYDQRYHGNSEGKFTTLGFKEKFDLYDVITDTFNRYGNDIYLGTYGESMGSATVLLESEIDNRIKFVISDCGFANFDVQIKEVLKKIKWFPRFPFLYIGSLMFKLISGTTFNGISPIKALKEVKVPILFCHGIDDNYINYHHAEDLYNYYLGPKELFLANNNSLHAESYIKDTENYEKAVANFIDNYLEK